MSSRALRKLGKQDDLINALTSINQETENPSDEEKHQRNESNKFLLLTAGEEAVNQDSDEEDASDKNINNENKEKCMTDNINQVKKKKKKSKKKNQAKNIPEKEAKKSSEILEDEVDKSIREVNEMLGITALSTADESKYGTVTAELNCKSLLSLEHRNLNAENEMRRRFGSSVVATERRRNPHARVTARSSWLVQQRPGWKPASKSGITMTLLENKNGYYYFTFEHSQAYQEIQFKFLEAVESLDHNNIVALLNNHPNHIDSILQLSEVCKINEDHQMASELIERALFIYERSFHTLFNVSRANCRLDYRRAENRPFFLALFRHMTSLGERACYRTSLEFCKLILGLDPTDELAILLMIDFYAVKSGEYEFLIRMHEEWEATKNLMQLPNFSFSIPLAMFHSQKYPKDKASALLQDALIKFPTTLLLLMDKCGVMLSEDVINFHYFQRTNDVKQSPGLNRLIALYVGRSYMMWKEPEVLDWLAECAKCAIERVKNNDPLCIEWQSLWKSLYQRVPLNIYRHIIISDIKEASRSLPPDISNKIIRMYDPLPPENSVCGYTVPERSQAEASDSGLVSLFLRSLLPSYGNDQQSNRGNNQPRQERQAPQGAEAADGPGLGNEINDSAQRLMGAMRELLNSMTYRGDLDVVEDDNGEQHIDQEWEDDPMQ